MGCSGCEETVAKAVANGCDQAREVVADHRTGTVAFRCGCAGNLPAIEAAIAAAGYKVAV